MNYIEKSKEIGINPLFIALFVFQVDSLSGVSALLKNLQPSFTKNFVTYINGVELTRIRSFKNLIRIRPSRKNRTWIWQKITRIRPCTLR